jgi:hypothetical protein
MEGYAQFSRRQPESRCPPFYLSIRLPTSSELSVVELEMKGSHRDLIIFILTRRWKESAVGGPEVTGQVRLSRSVLLLKGSLGRCIVDGAPFDDS